MATKQKVVGLTCPVHGDITKLTLQLNLPNEDGETVQHLYCYQCLNDILALWQEQGNLPRVELVVEEVEEEEGSLAFTPTAAAVKKAPAKKKTTTAKKPAAKKTEPKE